jgi:hypothetical protein
MLGFRVAALQGIHTSLEDAMSNPSRRDPILQKVETCNAAWAAFGDSCQREPTDGVGQVMFGTLAYRRWDKTHEAVARRWGAAFDRVLAARPKTREGAAALIDCFLQSERERKDEGAVTLLENLRAYLQTAA